MSGAGAWADLGAGTGTFTRALADLLGPGSELYAVDRSVAKVRSLRSLEVSSQVRFHVLKGDFDEALDLPILDGILLANALHFSPSQEATVSRVADRLRSGGRLLVVEYDRTRPDPWVPHPVPPGRFRKLASAAGLSEPEWVGTHPSRYHGRMYAAVARRA